MKKRWLLFVIAFFLTFASEGAARVYGLGLDWTMQNELKLEAPPLDVAASSDGKWIFVLVPEKVLVYSASDKRLVKEIPVQKGFERISYLPSDGGLLLSSGPEKRIAFIDLEPVQTFDLSGLPVRGPEKAPVTVVVFSDYQ